MRRPGLVLLILACLVPLFGSRWYVSPDGDDTTGDGTRANPWKTVKIAFSKASVAPLDSVVLMDGTYTLANQGLVNMRQIGPVDTAITWMAENPLQAIMDFTGVTHGQIECLRFDETDDGQRIQDIHFMGAVVDSSPFFYFAGGDRGTVDGCRFDVTRDNTSNNLLGVDIYVHQTSTEITIDGCTFDENDDQDYYDIRLVGTADNNYERDVVKNCTFNSPDDLILVGTAADTTGEAGGIYAVDIDSLVIENIVGYNVGNFHVFPPSTQVHPECIDLQSCDRVRVENVQFYRNRMGRTDANSGYNNADGINFYAKVSGTNADTLRVSRVYMIGIGHGMQIGNTTGTATTNFVRVSHFMADSTLDDAIFVANMAVDVTVSYLATHASGDNGIDIQASGVTAERCTIVRPLGAAINLTALSDGTALRYNLVYQPANYFVYHNAGATVVELDHNWYYDNTATLATFVLNGAVVTWDQWQAQVDQNSYYQVDPELWRPAWRPYIGPSPYIRGPHSMNLAVLRPVPWASRKVWPGAYAPWERR